MNYFTTSTFRQAVAGLTKKPKDGYSTVVSDICRTLQDMPANIVRDTKDRIKMFEEYRVSSCAFPIAVSVLPRLTVSDFYIGCR